MTLDHVKELMSEFKASDLTKLKLKHEGFEIELEKEKEIIYAGAPQVAAPVTVAPVATAEVNINTEKVEGPTGHQIKAPMVGTFYASSSPTTKPFVSVGSKVKKGDVICIIEAMKLMNEVESDVDGEVVAILVDNESMVEFDQPMFIIK